MYIFSLNQISLLTCTCSCEVGEIQKKRKEAMAKREEMGKRRINSEEEKGSGRLPFFLTVSVDHCSISLESLFASPPSPQLGQLVPLFLDVKNDILARITEQSKDDYNNDVSDKGSRPPPKRMNFRKSSKGGGSFSIQKFMLQNLDL